MNDGNAALKLGLERNYFYILKSTNETLYAHLKTKDQDLSIAWQKYIIETDHVRNSLQEIYFDLQDTRDVHLLAKMGIGIYKNQESARNTIEKSLFHQPIGHQPIRYPTFLKFTVLVNKWNEQYKHAA